jgi:hypothetical protein
VLFFELLLAPRAKRKLKLGGLPRVIKTTSVTLISDPNGFPYRSHGKGTKIPVLVCDFGLNLPVAFCV